MKVFYFDVETTGFDPVKNDITQIAGIIEIDGQTKDRFNMRCQPLNWDNINEQALAITGVSREKLKEYPLPGVIHKRLLALLGKYVDKHDRSDKFYMAGYNAIRFDADFLSNFFKKQNDDYFGSWFNWKIIDPFPVLYFWEWLGKIKLESYKLEAVCKYYNIEIDAHDAFSDISATRKLIYELRKESEKYSKGS
jgi:DNA polymerase III epsilon subunit-like protein|tara:strand:- start:1875 stop:2456 length:582 start_codon:yes stop_codon:yes gene_type:complete